MINPPCASKRFLLSEPFLGRVDPADYGFFTQKFHGGEQIGTEALTRNGNSQWHHQFTEAHFVFFNDLFEVCFQNGSFKLIFREVRNLILILPYEFSTVPFPFFQRFFVILLRIFEEEKSHINDFINLAYAVFQQTDGLFEVVVICFLNAF